MGTLHKAKRLDTGKWVVGNAVFSKDTEKEFSLIIIPCEDSGMFTNDIESDLGFENWYKCDPKTDCRYIGKNDDKGEKIWEHDIISINTYAYMKPTEDFFGEVVYCEAWACWCIKHPGEEKPIPLCECEGSYKTDICVIGNSIDNPELLERTDL